MKFHSICFEIIAAVMYIVLDDYGTEKIGPFGNDSFHETVLTFFSPSRYAIISMFFQVLDKAGDLFGIVLKISVHGHDVLVAGSLDPGVQGSSLAEFSPQADIFYWRETADDLPGLVGGAVIHNNDFKNAVVFRIDLNNLGMQPGDIALFIVCGNYNR